MSPTRPLRSALPALGWLALVSVVPAGCQSNAQHDLVARELRRQEDQIYALEDYIAQYQQLVCKYRSENAALRRQLADSYDDAEGEIPTPRARTPAPEGRPAPPAGPAFQSPETPRRTAPTPSDTQIEPPDVPPLEGSTSVKPASKLLPASYAESNESVDAARDTADSVAVFGRADEPPPADATAVIRLPPVENRAPHAVRIRGEVVANDSGGGPRLVVEVEPLDRSGRGTDFVGTLSLLLLAPHGPDGRQNLARWDFGPDEVQSAAEPSAGAHTLRFYLELPPDTPTPEPTEIWARLLPREGAKTLAHAVVDLRQPGEFASSHANWPAASPIASPRLTADSGVAANTPPAVASRAVGGEWKTAQGKPPANLPNESDDSGQWRAASEPMPDVQPTIDAVRPPRPVRPAAYSAGTHIAKSSTRTVERPTWSAERAASLGGKLKPSTPERAAASQRPHWSATR